MRSQKRNNNGGSRNSSSAFSNVQAGPSTTAANTRVVSAFKRSPRMVRGPNGSLRICNTERIVSPTFTDNQVNSGFRSFNPCSTTNLPWLSSIARNYGQYVVRNLKFSWVPRCPTTASAELQLAVFYDYADAAYYVASLAGSSQLDQFGEFAYGVAWAGGPLATHDSSLLNVPAGWFGVVADTDKIHARVQRFLCNNSSATVAGENQISACQLVWRSFTPAGTPVPSGTIYVSYDVEFFHPTLNLANAGVLLTAEESLPDQTQSCWVPDGNGGWVRGDCSPGPPPPAPKPKESDREVEA